MLREVETAELLSEENFIKDLEDGSKLHAVGMVRELYGKERRLLEGGRITIDFKRRAKEIISTYYDKDGIEKAFCCIKQPTPLVGWKG